MRSTLWFFSIGLMLCLDFSTVLAMAKKSSVECKVDADCVLVDADCCGCNNGGQNIVLPKEKVEAHKEMILEKCKDILCAAMISNDKTCKAKAVCNTGKCELEFSE